MDMVGRDLRSFVAGLDGLHARVQASMPDAEMPSFSVTDGPDDSLIVDYHSDRPGLAPMVIGLLTGVAERLGEHWEVGHLGRLPSDDGDRFRLDPVRVETAPSTGRPDREHA